MSTASNPCLVDVNNPEKVKEFTEAFLSIGTEKEALANVFYIVGIAYQNQFEKNKGQKYNLEKAIEFFNKAIVQDPNDYHCFQAKGYTLERLGSLYFCLEEMNKVRGFYEEAITSFTEAIKIKGDFAWAYNNRGIVNRLLGVRTIGNVPFYELKEKVDEIWNYLNEAQKDHNKAIELNESIPYFLFNRACNMFYLNFLILNETGKSTNWEDFDKANKYIKRDLATALHFIGLPSKSQKESTELIETLRFWYPVFFKYLKSELYRPYLENPPSIEAILSRA